MANMYRSVLSGGGAAVGDATAADVLTGKTFSGAVGSGVAGTMPNNGAVSGTASPDQPYTIPEGYHNGLGSVTASGSAHLVQNLNADSYALYQVSNATATEQSITSGNAITVPTQSVLIADVSSFTSGITQGDPIGSRAIMSADGVTWTAAAADITNAKYLILIPVSNSMTITFS